MEDIEKNLAGSKVARHLAKSNVDIFSKNAQVAEAQAIIAKSRLVMTKMELEALCSRQAKAEEEIREAIEKSKDAQFEKAEAMYLQQVE